jgi:hypothetical protein
MLFWMPLLFTDALYYTVMKVKIMHWEKCGSVCALFYATTAEFAWRNKVK